MNKDKIRESVKKLDELQNKLGLLLEKNEDLVPYGFGWTMDKRLNDFADEVFKMEQEIEEEK